MTEHAPTANLLETIAARRDDLRSSEKAVADLVLGDPVKAADLNMAGLADAAGVSEPTVMRFCSAIGFDGFRGFKLALVRTLALGLPVSLSDIRPGDSASEVTEKLFEHTIGSLDRARRTLDPARVAVAIDLMSAARELIFVGYGASGIVAQDAQQKFPLFGIPCQAPPDFHQQHMAVSMGDAGTVTVAISNTARTESTIAIAKTAKDTGGPVIAITGDEGPLSEIADVEIRVSTFEDTDFYTPTVSRLAALVIVDILATGVAMRRGPEWLERVQAMKQSLARMRG